MSARPGRGPGERSGAAWVPYALLIGLCTLFLGGAVAVSASLWTRTPGVMGVHGLLALVLGVVGAGALAAALMTLLFRSNRTGHDARVEERGRQGRP